MYDVRWALDALNTQFLDELPYLAEDLNDFGDDEEEEIDPYWRRSRWKDEDFE